MSVRCLDNHTKYYFLKKKPTLTKYSLRHILNDFKKLKLADDEITIDFIKSKMKFMKDMFGSRITTLKRDENAIKCKLIEANECRALIDQLNQFT